MFAEDSTPTSNRWPTGPAGRCCAAVGCRDAGRRGGDASGGPAARGRRRAPCAHLGRGCHTRRRAWRGCGAMCAQQQQQDGHTSWNSFRSLVGEYWLVCLLSRRVSTCNTCVEARSQNVPRVRRQGGLRHTTTKSRALHSLSRGGACTATVARMRRRESWPQVRASVVGLGAALTSHGHGL